jgi:hypothetical protein
MGQKQGSDLFASTQVNANHDRGSTVKSDEMQRITSFL